MDIHCSEDRFSDNEIFVGQITLKEIEKRVFPATRRLTVGYVHKDSQGDTNSSLKIIETHSAPDITPKTNLLSPTITKSESSPGFSHEVDSNWDINPDDSFIRLEQMVEMMGMTTEKQPNIIESATQSITNKYFFNDQSLSHPKVEKNAIQEAKEYNITINENPAFSFTDESIENQVISCTDGPNQHLSKTPLKNVMMNKLQHSPYTPQADIFKTPSSELKTKTPIFRTPGNPVSQKKITPLNKYKDVVSPVATYIRNSTQVPLMKDVCSKRPIPGVSSIPKSIKYISRLNFGNKENVKQENVNSKEQQEPVKLPAVAYRCAKETKVIDIPDISKMPKSQWAKQVASSIPRAMVVKHNHRETASAQKPQLNRQEDSFADLTLHQADLSVCTQKTEFTKPKK